MMHISLQINTLSIGQKFWKSFMIWHIPPSAP